MPEQEAIETKEAWWHDSDASPRRIVKKGGWIVSFGQSERPKQCKRDGITGLAGSRTVQPRSSAVRTVRNWSENSMAGWTSTLRRVHSGDQQSRAHPGLVSNYLLDSRGTVQSIRPKKQRQATPGTSSVNPVEREQPLTGRMEWDDGHEGCLSIG